MTKYKDTDPFYHSGRWKAFAESIRRRDRYKCQLCKRFGKDVPGNIVHHIKEREEYPELAYDPNNCVTLCEKCHNKMHPGKGRKSLEYSRRYRRYG